GIRWEGVCRAGGGVGRGRVGGAVLGELAGWPQGAAAQTLREIRRDDRPSLGRHRGLLSPGEQGLARLRRRAQQQNPGDPAPRLRLARRTISASQNSHLHAAGALTLTRFETPRLFGPSILTPGEQIKSRHLRAGAVVSLWT